MNDDIAEPKGRIVLTSVIVAAYASHNSLPASELPGLITQVHTALDNLQKPVAPTPPPQEPAVPVKKSITSDYLVCLEDGKKFKSLKRHLRQYFQLSPDEYRAKWGLPPDYPMVAPSYSARRSALAKATGLGRAK